MDIEAQLHDPLYLAMLALVYSTSSEGEPTEETERLMDDLAARIRAGEFTDPPAK